MVVVQKRKIRWVISLFLVMLYFSGLTAQAQYGGGGGEPNDPYLIYTAEQMNAIGAEPNDWDKHFKLMENIDLSGYAGGARSPAFNIIGRHDWPFTGTFGGNGKAISNFRYIKYTSGDTDCIGLFGYVEGAEIKDLGLTYPNIDAGERDYVGSLVGLLEDGTITDCYVKGGSIAGKYYVGGLVGRNLCSWGISPDDFVGDWLNDDPYTGGMTRLIIGRKIGGRGSDMTVNHGWGTITVPYTGNPFVAVYEADFKTETLTIRLVTLDSLHVHSSNVFHDGTNRDYEADYYMHRASGAATYAGGLVRQSYGNSTITNCYSTASISGAKDVGGLVGNNAGTISNCYAKDGNVSGNDNIGGLVGKNYATISNCYSGGDVSGGDAVGGLLGSNSYGTVTSCYSTSGVSGNDYVAGLVGQNWGGTVTNCRATGMVSGPSTISFFFRGVGGLVGFNSGTITNCYSIGSVSGRYEVGGLVGDNYGTITNCYSIGGVMGTGNVGGLVSSNEGSVTGSFWDVETSGRTYSAAGTGKTTAEMQMKSTFIGWGCEPDWTIDEGADYPRLAWENMPGKTIIAPSYYGTGSGTQADPYLLYTAEELNMIGLSPCEWDRHFKLMADIDLSAYTGTQFNMIGKDFAFPFTGVFDGNGHTVSNFTYTSTDCVGLFGYIDNPNAHIKDLGLIDPNVESETGRLVGSLAGCLGEGTITNCYVVGGSVSGADAVGGLLGANGYATITNCYAQGVSVSGVDEVGGLLGANGYGTITNCHAQGGSVMGTGFDVGGLVGFNWREGTITNCYAQGGSVMGTVFYLGGLVGYNGGLITNCYSAGSVSGMMGVGGLVGRNGGLITNCYSAGSVSGMMAVGGLVGENEGEVVGERNRGGGEVMESFWDTQTSGQVTSDGGTGKTTAEMQTESTFTDVGWDFVAESVNGAEDIWWILEGQDYPRLWWETFSELEN